MTRSRRSRSAKSSDRSQRSPSHLIRPAKSARSHAAVVHFETRSGHASSTSQQELSNSNRSESLSSASTISSSDSVETGSIESDGYRQSLHDYTPPHGLSMHSAVGSRPHGSITPDDRAPTVEVGTPGVQDMDRDYMYRPPCGSPGTGTAFPMESRRPTSAGAEDLSCDCSECASPVQRTPVRQRAPIPPENDIPATTFMHAALQWSPSVPSRHSRHDSSPPRGSVGAAAGIPYPANKNSSVHLAPAGDATLPWIDENVLNTSNSGNDRLPDYQTPKACACSECRSFQDRQSSERERQYENRAQQPPSSFSDPVPDYSLQAHPVNYGFDWNPQNRPQVYVQGSRASSPFSTFSA